MAPIKYPLATACAGCSSFHRYSLNPATVDRKSTRLNSSHSQISYAVFCLKKKKKTTVVFHSRMRPSTGQLPIGDPITGLFTPEKGDAIPYGEVLAPPYTVGPALEERVIVI